MPLSRRKTYARSDFRGRDDRVFRHQHRVHVRLREIVNMQVENVLAGIVAVGLLIYLVVALIRPEIF